jgi:hypothetical protein
MKLGESSLIDLAILRLLQQLSVWELWIFRKEKNMHLSPTFLEHDIPSNWSISDLGSIKQIWEMLLLEYFKFDMFLMSF